MHRLAARFAAALVALAAGVAAEPPKRIVSTAPGITEILFALGLGDRVVAVTQYCAYPPEVKRLPKIGSWTTPNMEVIAAARPDLIVVQRTAVHDSARFQPLKVRTLDVRLDRISDIYAAIETIAADAAVPARGRELSASIRRQLEELRRKVSPSSPTSVLFVVGRSPGSLDGIVSVGPKSYLSEIIEAAGGRNVLADSPVAYPKVLHEEILARRPAVIVDMGEHADASGITAAQVAKEIALWSRYASIPAVRNRRIHIVASEIFVVPGPRVTECARLLAKLLHPEAFR